MLLLLGLVCGLVIGMTGVGGGVLMVPVLIVLLGLSPEQAVGTALVSSCAIRLYAVLLYLRRRQVAFRPLAVLLAGGIPGVWAGARVLAWWRPGKQGLETAVIGGAVLLYAGTSLARSAFRSRRATERPRRLAVCAFPIGISVAVAAVGAGTLGTLALLGCTTLTPVAVVGTDLAFGFVLSAAGALFRLTGGGCDFGVLIQLTVSALAGATLGASVSGALPARALRGIVLASAAVLGGALLEQGIGKVF